MTRTRTGIAALATCLLLAAGCGDDSGGNADVTRTSGATDSPAVSTGPSTSGVQGTATSTSDAVAGTPASGATDKGGGPNTPTSS